MYKKNSVALERFVDESNKIEGIVREPLIKEVDELLRFLKLDTITVEELERFVKVYQPDARLRACIIFVLNLVLLPKKLVRKLKEWL